MSPIVDDHNRDLCFVYPQLAVYSRQMTIVAATTSSIVNLNGTQPEPPDRRLRAARTLDDNNSPLANDLDDADDDDDAELEAMVEQSVRRFGNLATSQSAFANLAVSVF